MQKKAPPYLLRETENCVRFISGRAALHALLAHLPGIRKAYVPLFTCDTVLEAFALRKIPVERYRIREDLAPILPDAAEDSDLLLLTNYFGLTGEQVAHAAAAYPGPVVVDAATALYAPPPSGIPCFYSPRKFCLAPTGGLALAPCSLSPLPPTDETDWRQLVHECASHNLQMQVIRSERALRYRTDCLGAHAQSLWDSFDWEADERQRCQNYTILHTHLQDINRLHLPTTPPSGPMCYPLLSGIPNLRDDLADAGLPLPLFWPEVIRRTNATDWENYLARNLLPLLLGPRLTEDDMLRIVRSITGNH